MPFNGSSQNLNTVVTTDINDAMAKLKAFAAEVENVGKIVQQNLGGIKVGVGSGAGTVAKQTADALKLEGQAIKTNTLLLKQEEQTLKNNGVVQKNNALSAIALEKQLRAEKTRTTSQAQTDAERIIQAERAKAATIRTNSEQERAANRTAAEEKLRQTRQQEAEDLKASRLRVQQAREAAQLNRIANQGDPSKRASGFMPDSALYSMRRVGNDAMMTGGVGLMASYGIAEQFSKYQTTRNMVIGNTLLSGGQHEDDVKSFGLQAIALVKQFGGEVNDTMKGFQRTFNHGYFGNDANTVMKSAHQITIGLGGNDDDNANALATIMRTYNWKAEMAGKAAELLHFSNATGNVDMPEFVKFVRPILAAGAPMGLKSEELLAGTSSLTQHGMPVNQAATNMRGIIAKLSAPTQQTLAVAKELGIEEYIGFKAFQKYGFDGVMKAIHDRIGNRTDLALKLINAQRGGTGLANLMSVGWDSYQEDVAINRDVMAGKTHAVPDAASRQQQNPDVMLQKFQGELLEVWVKNGPTVISIASQFLKITKQILEAFSGQSQWAQGVEMGLLAWGSASLVAVGGLAKILVAASDVKKSMEELKLLEWGASAMSGAKGFFTLSGGIGAVRNIIPSAILGMRAFGASVVATGAEMLPMLGPIALLTGAIVLMGISVNRTAKAFDDMKTAEEGSLSAAKDFSNMQNRVAAENETGQLNITQTKIADARAYIEGKQKGTLTKDTGWWSLYNGGRSLENDKGQYDYIDKMSPAEMERYRRQLDLDNAKIIARKKELKGKQHSFAYTETHRKPNTPSNPVDDETADNAIAGSGKKSWFETNKDFIHTAIGIDNQETMLKIDQEKYKSTHNPALIKAMIADGINLIGKDGKGGSIGKEMEILKAHLKEVQPDSEDFRDTNKRILGLMQKQNEIAIQIRDGVKKQLVSSIFGGRGFSEKRMAELGLSKMSLMELTGKDPKHASVSEKMIKDKAASQQIKIEPQVIKITIGDKELDPIKGTWLDEIIKQITRQMRLAGQH